MAKVVFDGNNLTMTINPAEALVDIKVDVYSDWKEWVLLADNSKHAPALRTIGGDPTVAGQFAGDIYFLINGWTLHIDVEETVITGVLYSDDFDTPLRSKLTGNRVYQAVVSSLVTGIAASTAPTPTEIWDHDLAPAQIADSAADTLKKAKRDAGNAFAVSV